MRTLGLHAFNYYLFLQPRDFLAMSVADSLGSDISSADDDDDESVSQNTGDFRGNSTAFLGGASFGATSRRNGRSR